MSHSDPLSIRISLRIPGDWSHPGELQERLPEGYRLTAESLILPDGASVEVFPMPPDDQFPEIFRSSCRRKPAEDELAILDRYTVNIGLNGPGGSLPAALTMMQAGVAILRAGGAGVFIDNSAMSHGGADWIDMTDDGGPDALSFAFTSIVGGPREIYTMGMQALGFPDILMRRADCDEHGETIIDIIRYVCAGDRPIDVGHILADEHGPRFQILGKSYDDLPVDSPMHNPHGRWKLVSAKDIAEGN